MILLAELMILVVLGILAAQGVDFRENHACQNRRQTNIILLVEMMILLLFGTLAVNCQRKAPGRCGRSSGVVGGTKHT